MVTQQTWGTFTFVNHSTQELSRHRADVHWSQHLGTADTEGMYLGHCIQTHSRHMRCTLFTASRHMRNIADIQQINLSQLQHLRTQQTQSRCTLVTALSHIGAIAHMEQMYLGYSIQAHSRFTYSQHLGTLLCRQRAEIL